MHGNDPQIWECASHGGSCHDVYHVLKYKWTAVAGSVFFFSLLDQSDWKSHARQSVLPWQHTVRVVADW